jgi:hypothetical protein
MGERKRALPQAFDDHDVELAVACKLYGRVEAIGRKAGAGSDAKAGGLSAHLFPFRSFPRTRESRKELGLRFAGTSG